MNPTVEVLRIVHSWPICFLVVMLVYKKAITSLLSLLPGAKIKLTIGQFSFEMPIPELEQSVTESLVDKKLTADQISLLTKLSKGRSPFDPSDLNIARPLRNAGLIKVPDGRFLQTGQEFAEEIEITTLGRYVVEAAKKNS
jgi:hypothetical protein